MSISVTWEPSLSWSPAAALPAPQGGPRRRNEHSGSRRDRRTICDPRYSGGRSSGAMSCSRTGTPGLGSRARSRAGSGPCLGGRALPVHTSPGSRHLSPAETGVGAHPGPRDSTCARRGRGRGGSVQRVPGTARVEVHDRLLAHPAAGPWPVSRWYWTRGRPYRGSPRSARPSSPCLTGRRRHADPG